MTGPKIAVIGGSLVGPYADLALRQQGYNDITVYEANPRPHSQSGGVMGVRDDTLDLLAQVGIGRDRVVALNDSDVYAFDVQTTGEPLHRGTSHFPGLVTSWDALHHQLTRRVDVQHGHAITGFEVADGRQQLACSCGTTHDADAVLWADGRKSLGRTLVDPDRPLQYNGYAVWRGLAAPPTPTPHGFHRYYDIPNGRLFSVTEPIVQSGKSYWEFSHNLTAAAWHTLARDTPERHAYMLPSQVGPRIRDMIVHRASGLPDRYIDMIKTSEISGIPVNDVAMPRTAIRYHRNGGWSALLGDALVPVRLQVGAGLNQGLHQAHGLAQAMTSGPAAMATWQTGALDRLGRMVEQGRSRAHRNNLGWYLPVRPGKTTAPTADQWDEPQWVSA